MKHEINSEAYIIENGVKITKVTITQYSGGFYTIRLPKGSAIRIRESRLFPSVDAAVEDMKKKNPGTSSVRNAEFGTQNADLRNVEQSSACNFALQNLGTRNAQLL